MHVLYVLVWCCLNLLKIRCTRTIHNYPWIWSNEIRWIAYRWAILCRGWLCLVSSFFAVMRHCAWALFKQIHGPWFLSRVIAHAHSFLLKCPIGPMVAVAGCHFSKYIFSISAVDGIGPWREGRTLHVGWPTQSRHVINNRIVPGAWATWGWWSCSWTDDTFTGIPMRSHKHVG
jgi:hypothetical protein